MSDFVKKPCKNCPFRSDVKPFLTSAFGEELAYSAQNPYNFFACHQTTEEDPCDSSEMMITEKSKLCAGFLTLQINEGADIPEGFEPAYDLVYADSWMMAQAYKRKK